MRRCWALGLALSAGLASSGAAQPPPGARITHRVALPLDGTPVDLRGVLGPERTLTLEGTVSSRSDGSEIDAFARRAGGVRFEADGPFVFLPPGTELIEEDPVAHRYLVRLPSAAPPTVAFALGRVAARQLQTRSQAAASLHGRIEVQVHGGPLAAAAAASPVRGAVARHAPASVASASWWLGLVALFPLGAWVLRRRSPSRRRDLARARRAVRSIDHEARRLGPAFDGVVVASRELLDRAQGLAAHRREIARALDRIQGGGEAAQRRRDALLAEARGVEANLAALVAHLEGVAAELAAQVAGHARVKDLSARLAEMGAELELALAADREVA